MVVGVGGAHRNAAAALCDQGEVLAFCEEERVTRIRHAGLLPGRPRGRTAGLFVRPETFRLAGRLSGHGSALVTRSRAEMASVLPLWAIRRSPFPNPRGLRVLR